MTRYLLVSFDLCPFVQRSAIVLEEKGVEYDIDYIDLAAKPDWFLQVSPLGKVPVLKTGEHSIFESGVIAEFLDETTPGPALLPAGSLEKAQQRMWTEYISAALIDAWRLSTAPDQNGAATLATVCHDKLARLETVISGPLFAGEHFTLADAAAGPLLQRLEWMSRVRPDLELFDGLPKVTAWRNALLERPSVKSSTIERIEQRFYEYMAGDRTETQKTDPSWLGGQVNP
ncbi:MAG: glutathione S-transferase [Myxococcota bacterium]|jgi:glutathione S-transferase